ncbi:cilia- and flagella-associated protein 57 [Bacillus rossius redtenbacheri]|uniref:cilia- and flagella-associated protein 57 n=1 Tax=Bacillus rossius redtenbacheri TaxID=93214 RepID=UPI002FDC8D48
MATPEITPHVIFGLKTGIKGNATYISDNELLYPVGAVLAVHNFDEKRQRYIKLNDKRKGVNIICVSNNKELLAVGDSGERASVSLYDLETLQLRKTLVAPPEITAAEFASLSFTCDASQLAALAGAPDWTVVFFNLARGRVDSSVRANNPSNPGPVFQVLCNPKDSTLVCAVGPGLFRLFGFSDAGWRPYGFQKSDALSLTCACWLTPDRVVAGTRDGALLFVDSGEVKAIVRRALDASLIVIKVKDEPPALSSISLRLSSTSSLDASCEVRELLPLAKGFAFACGAGTVHLFEREGANKYSKSAVLLVPTPHFAEGTASDLTAVQCLAAGASQDRVAATTLRSQLYSAPLWGAAGHDPDQVASAQFRELGESLHHGAVAGLATCAWKPVFMTCGRVDRTVRLWNHDTGSQQLERQYQDDVHCVALHPTGLFAAVGFSDKLRLVMLLMEELQPISAFPVRGCKECVFSASGHLLAAANGNIIQLFSTVSFGTVQTLTTHKGIVHGLAWAAGDQRLVSCGAEGAVYEWDVAVGRRVAEVIVKHCSFHSVAVTADGRTSFAVGSDTLLYEISNSTVVRALEVTGEELNCVTLSRSDPVLFLGTAGGAVLAVKFPLTEPLAFTRHQMHGDSISRMVLTHGDRTLVSCDADGAVCLWDVGAGRARAAGYVCTEVLVGRADLEDKLRTIQALGARVDEMRAEQAYQQQLDQKEHARRMADLRASCSEAIKELQDRIARLEAEHARQVAALNRATARARDEHQQALVAMETDYSHKLIVEYDKFQELELKMAADAQEYEARLEEAQRDREDALQALEARCSAQLNERDARVQELEEEARQAAREHEAARQLLEEDADQEIAELRATCAAQLREERAAGSLLRTEAGVLRKKAAALGKEMEEARHEAERLALDLQRLRQNSAELERDVADLKKEISERDTTIQAKEKRIYELQRKNQELEKFKFVLNYKIDELKKQLEPKDDEIKYKKEQIKEMGEELEKLEAHGVALDLRVASLRDQASGCAQELQAERERARSTEALLRRIRTDLHACSGHVQEPRRLKEMVVALYHKYCQDEEMEAGLRQAEAVQAEMLRQREHLETTIADLRAQLGKGTRDHRLKLMEENVALVAEVNSLRRQLSVLQEARRGGASELQLALASQHRSTAQLQAKIQEQEKTIALLRTEVQWLAGRQSGDHPSTG